MPKGVVKAHKWFSSGKPLAYGLGFAFVKSLVRLHNSLGSCESILGNLPRGQFYLPTLPTVLPPNTPNSGKPLAYALGFAFGKSLVRLHNFLGNCESIRGNLPREQFYLPTHAAFTLFIPNIRNPHVSLSMSEAQEVQLNTVDFFGNTALDRHCSAVFFWQIFWPHLITKSFHSFSRIRVLKPSTMTLLN